MPCCAALGSGVAAVVSVVDGKATLVVSVSDDLKDAVNAVELVKAGVAELGGKGGGGRADFAQGGGPDGVARRCRAGRDRTRPRRSRGRRRVAGYGREARRSARQRTRMDELAAGQVVELLRRRLPP